MIQVTKNVVTKHINKWDPIQLLFLGAPSDEYETEIEQLTNAIGECKDEIEIAEAIQDIFKQMFDGELNFDECLEVAKSIWKDLYLA